MKIQDKVIGPFFVDDEVDFHGLVDGNAYVRSGGILHLHGLVSGDLRVLSGGIATIHGTVNGFVENEGASVTIHGTVGGIRDLDATRPTVVVAGALVGPR